ncbi:MAG: NAD(P)H-dependent oxidoreductase [Parvibaculum sp.]|nr:NAD(P)H-dependent oxidoreductase [Parvibaculum sp.]
MFVPVIYGSVRRARVGLRAAKMVAAALEAAGDEALVVDPARYNLPLLDKRIFEFEDGEIPEGLGELSQIFKRGDAYVFVTAEYNHCIPPALKNMMDHFGVAEFAGRPAGIVSYSVSRFGGVRAAEQIRLLAPSFGLITIPMVLSIPDIENAMDSEGRAPAGSDWPPLTRDFLAELSAWARAAPGMTKHDGRD